MADTATVQLLVYALLTFAGVCIASAALLFSYRQNYGWPPLALVTSHGLSGVAGEQEYFALLDFEFWNRRKYPVVVRSIDVDFGELRVCEKQSPSGEMLTWHTYQGKAIEMKSLRVDPSTFQRYECKGAFPKRSLDDLSVKATISIRYFDPLANRVKTLIVVHPYNFKSG